MAILGIESAVYGVEDLALGTRFHDDFGLPLRYRDEAHSIFELEEGSRIILRRIADPLLPKSHYEGPGVRETFWGVDTQANLDLFEADLRKDREVTKDPDGALRFCTDCGIAMGLRLWRRRKVAYAPDPLNAPDNIKRLNTHRKWRTRARPKAINHIVFRNDDPDKSWPFFRDRLHFRLSDVSRGAGWFGRADGASQHHTIFFLATHSFGQVFTTGFDHLCYGVEDIDELMAGFNYMERRGWESPLGLGRHRIASSLFCYINNPCGGQAEYGADTDYLDDNWIPRIWEPMFGGFFWTSRVPPWMPNEVAWEVRLHPDYIPSGATPEKVTQKVPRGSLDQFTDDRR